MLGKFMDLTPQEVEKHATARLECFETEPIGGGNPYSRCLECGRSVPEISSRGHFSRCPWRKYAELVEGLRSAVAASDHRSVMAHVSAIEAQDDLVLALPRDRD